MLNNITLMGRLTSVPELRHTANSTPVASFTLAVDRDFKDKDGEKQTDFINCVAWRSTAEFFSKYFDKGSMAIVSGRVQVRHYEDKDGNKRTATEVVAENVYFGESRRDSDNRGTTAAYVNSYGGYKPPRGTDYTQSPLQELGDEDGGLPF